MTLTPPRIPGQCDEVQSSASVALLSGEVPRLPYVLSSWKEIGQYLGKGVRTVQRWEQEFDLPVRRTSHQGPKSGLMAVPAEIDAWVQTRALHIQKEGSRQLGQTEMRNLVAELREEIRTLRCQLDLSAPVKPAAGNNVTTV